MWTTKSKEDLVFSSADEYKAVGVLLTPGDNNRLSGKRKIDRLLADLPDGMPGMMVFDTCVNLIDQMENLVTDEKNPEDVDTDQEDHAYDTARYGVSAEKDVTKHQPKPSQNSDLWSGIRNM
jgi:hypothetical protein